MWRLAGGRLAPGADKLAADLKSNLNFKGLQGPTAGSVFSEALSKNFVDNCITVHDRLVVHPEMVSLVLKYPNVWDKLNKLHVLVYKAGSKPNIQWVLETLDDMLTTGLCSADDLSKRALQGHTEPKVEKGQVAFIIAKRQCKEYLLQHAQTTFGSGWQPESFVKMHEVFSSPPKFREAMRSLAWQRDLPKSNIRFLEILEGVMVGSQYDEQLRVQVNNSRSPADFHQNMSDLKKDFG